MPILALFLGVIGVILVSAVALLALVGCLIAVEIAGALERRRSPDASYLDTAG